MFIVYVITYTLSRIILQKKVFFGEEEIKDDGLSGYGATAGFLGATPSPRSPVRGY
jgi:hypothetical protein